MLDPYFLPSFILLRFYAQIFSYPYFIAPDRATLYGINVDGSTISKIINAWYRNLKSSSLQYLVNCDLISTNIEIAAA